MRDEPIGGQSQTLYDQKNAKYATNLPPSRKDLITITQKVAEIVQRFSFKIRLGKLPSSCLSNDTSVQKKMDLEFFSRHIGVVWLQHRYILLCGMSIGEQDTKVTYQFGRWATPAESHDHTPGDILGTGWRNGEGAKFGMRIFTNFLLLLGGKEKRRSPSRKGLLCNTSFKPPEVDKSRCT